MQLETCKPRILASSAGCDLWMCSDCGIVNLGIGPVSIRLKPEHFKKITETMQDALQKLLDTNTEYKTAIRQNRRINH